MRAGHVDIWRVSLDDHAAHLTARRSVLSSQEAARADRFAFPENRDLYVLTRGRLRMLLGHYLSVAPRSVRFRVGERGKPELDGAHRTAGVWFNVAHSGRLGCIAITAVGPLGVDVERIRPDVAGSGLPERFFSAEEVAVLRQLAPVHQERAFFECWTRKEAYIKAIGMGLSAPLARFSVSLSPREPPELLEISDAPDAAGLWSMSSFDPAPGFVAALVVEGKDWSIAHRQWLAPSPLQGRDGCP